MKNNPENLIKQHNVNRHAKSFYYAGRGLSHVFMNEANFRVHILAVFLVSGLAFQLKFNYIEWILLIFTMGFVVILEIINSLIEELIDHLVSDHHESARIIKDLSAATVLVSAIVSVVVGIILFLPKVANYF